MADVVPLFSVSFDEFERRVRASMPDIDARIVLLAWHNFNKLQHESTVEYEVKSRILP